MAPLMFDFQDYPDPDPDRTLRANWQMVPVEPFAEAALVELCALRLAPDLIQKVLELKGESATLLESFAGTDMLRPAWFIHYMQPSKTLVVVVRGTTNSGQWVTHLSGVFANHWKGSSPLINYYVHAGMERGSQLVVAATLNIVRQLGVPDRVILIGHSYGGGVVNVLWDELRILYGPQSNTRAVTFGAPRTFAGPAVLAAPPKTYYRVQHQGDAITQIPPPLLNPRGLLSKKGISAAISALGGKGLFAFFGGQAGGAAVGFPLWKHWGRGLDLLPAYNVGNPAFFNLDGGLRWSHPPENSAEGWGPIRGARRDPFNDHYMDEGYWPAIKTWAQRQGWDKTPYGRKFMALAEEITAIDPVAERTPDWRGIVEELAELARQTYVLPPTTPPARIAESEAYEITIDPPAIIRSGNGDNMATSIQMLFTLTTGTELEGTPQRTGDWSEEVWHAGNDYNAVLATIQPSGPEASDSLWAYRRHLLPPQCKIIGYRLQAYELVGGQKVPVGGVRADRLGLLGTSTVGSNDIPQSAVELRMKFVNRSNAITLRLAGVPDAAVEGGEITGTANRFDRSLNAYTMRLALMGLGSVVEDVDNTTPQKIATITPDAGPNPLKLATVRGLLELTGFVEGGQAVVRRSSDVCKKQRGGHFRVTDFTGGILKIAGWDWASTKRGIVFPLVRSFAAFDGARSSWVKAVVRKVGLPFDRFRGRRTKRTG